MVNTIPYRYIHISSLLYCNKDIYNQKSNNRSENSDLEEKHNLESDWAALSNDEIKKYKYWETPLDYDEVNTADNDKSTKSLVDFQTEKLKKFTYEKGVAATTAATDNNDNDVKSDTKIEALTHTDQSGSLNMVDIGSKGDSSRTAVAVGTIFLGQEAFNLVKENKMKKGDVLTVAKLAGITGAKRTSELIPLCHNIPISKIDVDIQLVEESCAVTVSCLAKTYGKTGVEMEAITGVAIATITIYDMCKAVTKDMVIGDIKLTHKSGGKSGDYNSAL